MSERCAIHPDRAAEITCTRCGSYACYECVGPTSGGVCGRCRMRLGGGSDRVGQLKICAIITIIHGVLMGLFGGLYVMMGGAFSVIPLPPSSTGEDPPQWLLFVILAGFGLVNLVPGIMQIAGGVAMLRHKGRVFAMVAYGVGFLSMFGCYCFATSLALAVWGLILLSDVEVRAAFEANDPV